MRDFIDSILYAIDAVSISDLEFTTFDYDDLTYSMENFESIKAVLASREMLTDKIERLTFLFRGHGLGLSDEDAETPCSNILIGIPL